MSDHPTLTPEQRKIADDREWIKDWRDKHGWPIEMHGVVMAWEERLNEVEALRSVLGVKQARIQELGEALEDLLIETFGDPHSQGAREKARAVLAGSPKPAPEPRTAYAAAIDLGWGEASEGERDAFIAGWGARGRDGRSPEPAPEPVEENPDE